MTRANKRSLPPITDIAELEARAEVLDRHARSLAHSLGLFHGINDRLQRGTTSGRGAVAITTLLFDQSHIVAVRTHTLAAEPDRASDVTLQTFVDALDGSDLGRLVVERAARWHGGGAAEHFRPQFAARVARLRPRLAAIRGLGGDRLRLLRNKVLAHATIEADQLQPVSMRELWNMAARSVSLAGEIHLLVKERAPLYHDRIRLVREDAGFVVGLIRDAENKVLREDWPKSRSRL